MKQRVDLHTLLSQATDKDQQIASFALLSLGVIESLVGGAITASSALELFFHADNCLFVRKQLRQKIADEIMSRGVQLLIYLMHCPRKKHNKSFSENSRRCACYA